MATYQTTVEPGEDLKLRTIVCQFGGYSSMAWESPEGAGDFRGELVLEASEAVVTEIKHTLTLQLSRLLDKTGTAEDWNRAIEAAIRTVEGAR